MVCDRDPHKGELYCMTIEDVTKQLRTAFPEVSKKEALEEVLRYLTVNELVL